MMTIRNFMAGVLGMALLVGVLTTQAQAQMPADTQFINDIRDRKYNDSLPYLVNGGPPNARDYNGVPAIVAAAEIGDAGMIKELLKYGANPDLATRDTGMTALMNGAARGNILVIAVLATNDADMDVQDNLGETALIKAVKEGHREVIRHLIDAGADIHITDYSGYSAYDHGMRSRDYRVKSLIKKAGGS